MDTLFYHGLGFQRGGALGGFTGSIRIKNYGFVNDVFRFWGVDGGFYGGFMPALHNFV